MRLSTRHTLELKNVVYIPSMRRNLISIMHWILIDIFVLLVIESFSYFIILVCLDLVRCLMDYIKLFRS